MRMFEVAGRKLLFVIAAEPEYGPALRSRFSPLMTGVGPVEAAVATARALAGLAARGGLPDLLVSLGSAGSRTLAQASVHQIASVSYRDMDASPLGFAKGQTPFLDLPGEIALPLRVPGMSAVRLSTGAGIVSGAAYDAIDADMVDMESYAIVRACMAHGVPVIGLRGVSDGRDDLNHIGDWTRYLHVIDERLAEAVDKLLAALADGKVEPARRK
jgi:adenosylhomocysteine nucleosidase